MTTSNYYLIKACEINDQENAWLTKYKPSHILTLSLFLLVFFFASRLNSNLVTLDSKIQDKSFVFIWEL